MLDWLLRRLPKRVLQLNGVYDPLRTGKYHQCSTESSITELGI